MTAELRPTRRMLMGPGPSDVHDRVLRALSAPVLGHLDPEFLALMDGIQQMLRGLFKTENRMTMPMSGTGSAGMETCFVNLLEPGDAAVIGVNGVFGGRMAEVSERCGATVTKVEAPWGQIVPEDAMIETIRRVKPKVVGLVHAETSTGAWQPVEAIAAAAREVDALLILDCVTSLGGCPVEIDAWGVDAAYSGTQKCLSCPPGLAPVTLGDRAMAAVAARKHKVQSWYLDLSLLANYWGGERAYHHTAPISMNYGLYEALRMVFEEGIEARHARHRLHHEALYAGLQQIGIGLANQEGHRLPMLNPVEVPAGIDEASVRKELLERHNIEVGAGLGPLKGKVWRVGIMGASCSANHVALFLSALENALRSRGAKVGAGAAAAAMQHLEAAETAAR
ncbi:alanine--glyoxylate aminotransferase [Acidobacteria bacterium Mor1]|nr:alanine--glyoxylate aminotransferase [Acidobacteria bacterium Mor1]